MKRDIFKNEQIRQNYQHCWSWPAGMSTSAGSGQSRASLSSVVPRSGLMLCMMHNQCKSHIASSLPYLGSLAKNFIRPGDLVHTSHLYLRKFCVAGEVTSWHNAIKGLSTNISSDTLGHYLDCLHNPNLKMTPKNSDNCCKGFILNVLIV